MGRSPNSAFLYQKLIRMDKDDILKILYSRLQSRKDGSAIHSKELTNALQKLGVEIFTAPLFFLERKTGTNVSVTEQSQMAGQSKAISGLKKMVPRVAKELIAPLFNLRYVVGEIVRAQEIINTSAPDILLIRIDCRSINYFWLANLMLRWKAKQNHLPLVLEVNAPLTYEYQRFFQGSNYLYWNYPFLASIFEKKIWQNADAIICVSNQLKDFLVRAGVAPTKISVIPNGVDLDKFSLTVKGDSVRKKYNLGNKIVVGFIGSLKTWHGIDNLIKSLNIAVSKNDRIHCLIVGNLDDYSDMHNIINREGLSNYIALAGNIQYGLIPEYLAAMDIATAPYPDIENFYFSPIKIFEYMAMSKPVVASRIGQIEEIIAHGHNGYLVRPGNIQELAQGILELAGNPEFCKQLGKNARRTVEENYTWEKNAQAIKNICESVLINRERHNLLS